MHAHRDDSRPLPRYCSVVSRPIRWCATVHSWWWICIVRGCGRLWWLPRPRGVGRRVAPNGGGASVWACGRTCACIVQWGSWYGAKARQAYQLLGRLRATMESRCKMHDDGRQVRCIRLHKSTVLTKCVGHHDETSSLSCTAKAACFTRRSTSSSATPSSPMSSSYGATWLNPSSHSICAA